MKIIIFLTIIIGSFLFPKYIFAGNCGDNNCYGATYCCNYNNDGDPGNDTCCSDSTVACCDNRAGYTPPGGTPGCGQYWGPGYPVCDTGNTSCTGYATACCAGVGAPTNLNPGSGASVAPGTMTFSWSAVSGADKYNVTINDNTASSNNRTFNNITSTSVSFTIIANHSYTWTVQSARNCGSTNSTTVSFNGTNPPSAISYGNGYGLITYSNNTSLVTSSDSSLNISKISSKQWRAATAAPTWLDGTTYYYNWWLQKLSSKVPAGNYPTGGNFSGVTNLNAGLSLSNLATNSVNYYHVTGDLRVLNDQQLSAGSTNSVVFLVDGNLDIRAKIIRPNKGAFLGFFVQGTITVDPSVENGTNPSIDGFFLSNGAITFPKKGASLDSQIIANGIYIGFGGITMSRNLGNDLTTQNPAVPAEKFTFDPSLVINAPADLMKSNYSWQEIAP